MSALIAVLIVIGAISAMAAMLSGWAVVTMSRERAVRRQERAEDLAFRQEILTRLPELTKQALPAPAARTTELRAHFGPGSARDETPSDEPPEVPSHLRATQLPPPRRRGR